MAENIVLPEGQFRVPYIEGAEPYANQYPYAGFYIEDGSLGLDSVLQGERRLFDEFFVDPRAANFVDAITRHQFHHLDTRQLCAPERFETRDGAGRMDRLTTLVESAIMAARLGATFEQIAQIMLSDINVTVDSHRLGDHLVGDYADASRDEDIGDYVRRSGLHEYFVQRGVMDEDGGLAGSPVNLYALANPNAPRRHDIVECPRPDGNADRTPFTLIEGLYLVDHKLILDAARTLVRVEVAGAKHEIQERMAFTNVDSARLLYVLSLRHETEHWSDLVHRALLEMLSAADKSRLTDTLTRYDPIDYARTAEHQWYLEGDQLPFISEMYDLTERLATEYKETMLPVQRGEMPYTGSPRTSTITHKIREGIKRPTLHVARDTSIDAKGQLLITVPAHKHRKPIDSYVVTRKGMRRVSQEAPDLRGLTAERSRWLGGGVVCMTLPWDVLGGIQEGLRRVHTIWHEDRFDRTGPLNRPPMERPVLSRQIDQARKAVVKAAFV